MLPMLTRHSLRRCDEVDARAHVLFVSTTMRALCSAGVKGVDVSMQLPGRAVIGTVREILAAMKVGAMLYIYCSAAPFHTMMRHNKTESKTRAILLLQINKKMASLIHDFGHSSRTGLVCIYFVTRLTLTPRVLQVKANREKVQQAYDRWKVRLRLASRMSRM